MHLYIDVEIIHCMKNNNKELFLCFIVIRVLKSQYINLMLYIFE